MRCPYIVIYTHDNLYSSESDVWVMEQGTSFQFSWILFIIIVLDPHRESEHKLQLLALTRLTLPHVTAKVFM